MSKRRDCPSVGSTLVTAVTRIAKKNGKILLVEFLVHTTDRPGCLRQPLHTTADTFTKMFASFVETYLDFSYSSQNSPLI